jgi:hypothetical protein
MLFLAALPLRKAGEWAARPPPRGGTTIQKSHTYFSGRVVICPALTRLFPKIGG